MSTATDVPPHRTGVAWYAAAVAVSVLLLVVSAASGVPGGARQLGAYLDASVESNLPTWWSTALYTVAALAHALAAVTVRVAGLRGGRWWLLGALAVAGLSLAEHSGMHDRVAAAGGRPDLVLPLLGAAVLAVLGTVALRVGGRAGRRTAAGAVVTVLAALGGQAVAEAYVAAGGRGGPGHVLAVHLGELGENLGALLLLAAAASVLEVRRAGGSLRVGHHATGPAVPAVPVAPAAPPVPGRVLWAALGLACAAVGAASLAVVLLGPQLAVRPYLDVLVEDNLPTWWSSALLLVGALAHAVAALARRAAGAPGVAAWAVTALLLAALSLDDHTGLHERSEAVGRWLVTPGSYPFLWLIPGAVAGAGLAAAVVVLAVRSRGRLRALLLAGIGLLLVCALGLEAVQGLFMQAANEGVGFVVTYHVEELGENIAALLLLGSGCAAVSVTAADGRLVITPRPGR